MHKDRCILHRGVERGKADYGWLKANYSFSFAQYFNPLRMGVGKLRVINDDTIAGGAGFDPHGHRDMEIVTIILEGAIKHEDNAGNQGVIRAGEVQVMSAGTGIVHSEFNVFQDRSLRLFQVWIETAEKGAVPRYDQKSFNLNEAQSKWQLLVSGDGAEGSLRILQNAKIWRTTLQKGNTLKIEPWRAGRRQFLMCTKGKIGVLDYDLEDRDALEIADGGVSKIYAAQSSEALLFDVPA